MFPLGMVAGFALGGVVIQRSSPARLLLAGLSLVAAGSLGFIFGTDLAVYAVSRLVMGLGSGCLWLGITFATPAAWPGQEYLCMSRIYAAYSAGGLMGPLLVPHQATFALSTTSRSRSSAACLFRQMM
ncbi:hypothetical protein [Streptomyces sp. NPDC057301]|uniref:hypothetical protein n=1 Tax=Streptomyces sp. NPDC057301 TaxID=3346093 RepID=UPI0036389765